MTHRQCLVLELGLALEWVSLFVSLDKSMSGRIEHRTGSSNGTNAALLQDWQQITP
jgi:hypothetical protein